MTIRAMSTGNVVVSDFDAWFSKLSGSSRATPHEWQRQLVADPSARTRLIRIPTGMGKTLGVLAAWTWHRLHLRADTWPRRLVWCLPMRVLVEQTEAVIRDALGQVGAVWDGSADHVGKVGVHLLMGGVDPGGDWNLFPEECAVLIGTQDMLLSRALNRGYATGRARWPQEFGLLSHDALWVMDEVQLMDVGLATSAQLQAYLDQDAAKSFRPRCTWWMSATLQPEWLRSVDTEPRYDDWVRDPSSVAPRQLDACFGAHGKALSIASISALDGKALARRALAEHKKVSGSAHGRITLVVCNTVLRACETFDELRAIAPMQELHLVHSRFRPAERSDWRKQFLSRAACSPEANRIIVATQVVEAGVDVSAGCIVTDLAPWPSLVQRFGRCARYGGDGACLVVDRGRDEDTALPYEVAELETTWDALEKLSESGADVGVARLERFEASLGQAERRRLFPYEPRHLLLRGEFDELFDTTPDLSGADLDISRFIRAGDERDLQVFWRDVPRPTKAGPKPRPSAKVRPQRHELCPIPFLRARDWLCGAETKVSRKPRLRDSKRAWVWDWTDGEWVVADRSLLTPGRVVLVAADSGGYRLDRGFDPDSDEAVRLVPLVDIARATEAETQASDCEGADDVSIARWKTIGFHGAEVAEMADRIGDAVNLPPSIRRILVVGGKWHDLGKAHAAFQGSIRLPDRPDRQDLAKAPDGAWLRPPGNCRTADDRDRRPGLRHELASALALFAVLKRHQPMHPALLGPWVDALRLTGNELPSNPGPSDPEPTPCERAVLECSAHEFDLLAYLVACHHGKVRVALHAGPRDQDYRDPGDGRGLPIRGVREGDVLPSVVLDGSKAPLPPLTLTLEPASLGLSARTGRSWRERTLDLVDRLGPGAVAWLEVLLIAADRRASRLTTSDPALTREETSR